MPAVVFTPEDLLPFAVIEPEKALLMIEDALAMAARVAPCIEDEDFEYSAAAKAILRRAILRWNEAGTGATVQQQAGPFGQTIETKTSRGLFWPSEIEELQRLCTTVTDSGAFTIDGLGAGTIHSAACNLFFGALYCSCGADIAGFPLYEGILYP